MGCGIIFPRESSPIGGGEQLKKRPSQIPPCDSDDLLHPGSSSEDPTPSEFSSQSDQEEEDDSFFGSDDSEGLYEHRDANDRWPLGHDDYRLLAIGRGFPVQFVQERRMQQQRPVHRHKREPGGGGVGESQSGPKVEVFFTRNGVIVGQKEIAIPRGGFFPTIGMLSSAEKVKVELHPLTG
jgi:hypothetical protein